MFGIEGVIEMEESKNRKLGAILSYVSIIVNTLIQLIYMPFLIKNLGQSEYGLYSLVNSIIGYLTILDLGFGNAIIVYTAKYRAQKRYEEEKKLHGMFFLVFCIIGLIAGIGGIILYFNVNELFGATMTEIELHKAKIMMLILTFNLVISFIFNIYSSILIAYERFVYQKLISLLNTILKPVVMIPLLFIGFKSITMVLVITVLNIMVLLSNYFYCKTKLKIDIKYKGFDKIIFKTILGYSVWIFLGSIVDKINWSADQFILGMVSGTIAVSIYSVASTLNTLFINLSTAISGVLLPKVSEMVENNATNDELTDEMIKVGRIQYYIILLMITGLILVGKDFIIWWVGKSYIESYYVSLILIIPLCFPLIQNLGLSIMQAMNKYKFRAISTFIMAIFNIGISYLLAKKYGAIGAAVGTAISLIICNIIVTNIYYYKIINIDVLKFWKNIIKMTIPFCIPFLFVIIIMRIFSFNGLYNVAIYGTLYTIVFTIIAYFITMNEYEKNFINKILKKLKLIKE